MSRAGRYLPYAVAALARVNGRYETYWWPFAAWRGCSGPCRWPLSAVLAVTCCVKWRLWPVWVAVMSRVGRYLSYGVAALARIAGRYEPYWPLFAVLCGFHPTEQEDKLATQGPSQHMGVCH